MKLNSATSIFFSPTGTTKKVIDSKNSTNIYIGLKESVFNIYDIS